MCGGYTGEFDVSMQEKPHSGGEGIQRNYNFVNGTNLSAIKTPWSYGGNNDLWEIAVLDSDGNFITQIIWNDLDDDVIGHLDDDALYDYVSQVQKFDSNQG